MIKKVSPKINKWSTVIPRIYKQLTHLSSFYSHAFLYSTLFRDSDFSLLQSKTTVSNDSSIAFHFIPPIKTKLAFFHVKLPIFTISPVLFPLHSKTTPLIFLKAWNSISVLISHLLCIESFGFRCNGESERTHRAH